MAEPFRYQHLVCANWTCHETRPTNRAWLNILIWKGVGAGVGVGTGDWGRWRYCNKEFSFPSIFFFFWYCWFSGFAQLSDNLKLIGFHVCRMCRTSLSVVRVRSLERAEMPEKGVTNWSAFGSVNFCFSFSLFFSISCVRFFTQNEIIWKCLSNSPHPAWTSAPAPLAVKDASSQSNNKAKWFPFSVFSYILVFLFCFFFVSW